MKKYAFLILFILINLNMDAQAIEKLAKDNSLKVCSCIEQIDSIDSRVDFEFKVDACTEPVQNPTILSKDTDSLEKYQSLLDNYLSDCSTIERLINNLWKSLAEEAMEPTPLSAEAPKSGQNIIGTYDLRFGNRAPLNMARLSILPDGTYSIASFGEIQTGRWKVVKEKYLHLIPARPQYPFQIYGRYNPDLGDTTKTAFLGDDFSYNTLIHYGPIKTDTPTMSPIFNKNANCFSYPNTYTNQGKFKQISLVYRQLMDKNIVYTFENNSLFNDFAIVERTSSFNKKPTRVIIGDNELIFRKNKVTKRRPFNNKIPKTDYFKEYMDVPNDVYFNAGYKHFESENILSENYKFNKDQNTYICILSIEYPTDDPYDNISHVNKYERLQNISTEKKQIKTGEKSIIYTVCD